MPMPYGCKSEHQPTADAVTLVMWYEPEDLGPEQDLRDDRLGRTRFYVYVLETERGHYVGHTGDLSRRLHEHRTEQVESTRGTNPVLVWQSVRSTRRDAAEFEAALKSLRDQESPRFVVITGFYPLPWLPASQSYGQSVSKPGVSSTVETHPRSSSSGVGRTEQRRSDDDWWGRIVRWFVPAHVFAIVLLLILVVLGCSVGLFRS